MKIVINLMDCKDKEEFDLALKLFKSLKYPRSHNNKTLDICDCISDINLEATYDELKDFVSAVEGGKMSKEGCGKTLGYKHESGSEAYCGEEVFRGEKIGLAFIYCEKCNRFVNLQKSEVKE